MTSTLNSLRTLSDPTRIRLMHLLDAEELSALQRLALHAGCLRWDILICILNDLVDVGS